MKRSKSKRSSEAMTLFPFLAVLVCTMGILIVLLVIVTKLADDRAQQTIQQAEEQSQAQMNELEDTIAIEQMRVDGIRKMRAGLQEKLEDQRSIRSHIEDEIRALRDEAEKIKSDYRLLTQRAGAVKLVGYDREIQQLQQKLKENRQEVATLRQQNLNQPTVYSLVPHSGKGEANRRPIYVECTTDGIVLQPYGIRLTRSDFTQPVIPGNPFDSALLAVREHWKKNGLVDLDTRPYPLLVVRPGGESNYGLARRALKTWEDQFGYELIENQKKLDFGEDDEILRGKIEQAIVDAKKFQTQIAVAREREKMRALRQIRGGQGRGGMRASPTGGFVADGQPSQRLGSSSFSNERSSNGFANSRFANQRFENQSGESRGGGEKNGQVGGRQNSQRGNMANQRQSQFTANRGSGQFAGGNQTAPQFSAGNPQQNNSQSSASQAGAASSLANSRGKGWALPTRTQGATAYKRPIKVICGPKEILLRANASTNQSMIRVAIDESYTQTVDRMVQKVWNIIDSWDLAAARGYWKPELVIEVKPGGENHFRQIKRLLRDSGLDVKGSTP